MNTKRIAKFLITGVSAAVAEYGIFVLLYGFIFDNQFLVISQVSSFLIGFAISFLLNKFWVFQTKGWSYQELIKYSILAAINLVLSSGVLWLLTSVFGIVYWVSKFVVMAMVAVWNYLIFQKIIFKQ